MPAKVGGTLDKVEEVVRFTSVSIRAGVTVPAAADSRAQRILHKAKDTCLVSNSLICEVSFVGETTIVD